MCVSLDSTAKVVKVIETAKCCKVEGCKSILKINKRTNEPKLIKGYCVSHYNSFYAHGDALFIDKRKASELKRISEQCCKIEGCKGHGEKQPSGSTVFILGYCTSHYMKFRSYGDPLISYKISGQQRRNNPNYGVYRSILSRCNNPKDKGYKNYGSIGIKVCEEWQGLYGFDNFIRDVGERPSSKHSIERRKVNEGYNKDNCKWALIHVQASNKRNSNKTVGVSFIKNKNRWVASFKHENIYILRKSYPTEQEAIDARHKAEREHFGCLISEL